MTAGKSRDSAVEVKDGAGDQRFSAGVATQAYRAGHGIYLRLSILSVLLTVSGSLSAVEPIFDLKKVADGVYIALARRQPIINSNAAVIILDDGVLVVDTHSKPSAARALIEQIKTVTDKPVRYVVDTHFHYDHFQGNSAYLQAFPGQVENLYASGATLDEIKKNVDLSIYESLMGVRGVGSGLGGALNDHIEKAYREISWSP